MKRGIAIFLAVVGIFWGNVASAQEIQPIITEANFYTGVLYYCDEAAGVAVLKDVNAMGTINQTNTKTAAEAEYTELPVMGPAIFKDGTKISLSDCNYYPDSEVRMLIVRSSDGTLRILQLKFM